LTDRNYRVLFLPHSRAVSDAEIARIFSFVRQGGVVVADIVPAILAGTGAKRAAPGLAPLFPSDKPGTVTPLDKGRAVLLGTDALKGYYEIHKSPNRAWTQLEGRWRRMTELLATHAHVKPAVTVEAVAGDMPPTEIARFDADGIELVGLIRSYFLRDRLAYDARIRLPRQAHLYDVRAAKYLAHASEAVRPLDYQAELLALLPYKVQALTVRIEGAARAGKPLHAAIAISAEAGRPVTGKHGVHVTVVGPNGAELSWYAQNLVAPRGAAAAAIPLALNEKPGSYVVRASDCVSGVTGEARFTIPHGGSP